MITARQLQTEVNYATWRNFNSLVMRAKNLIANGVAHGKINKIKSTIKIGSGALRTIKDYELDKDAMILVRYLANSYKLGSSFPIRNETAILALLKKYCIYKKWSFDFQFKLEGKIYDFRCENKLIEFDEPHHTQSPRQKINDLIKNKIAIKNGFTIFRFTLDHDIIDIIIKMGILTLGEQLPGLN